MRYQDTYVYQRATGFGAAAFKSFERRCNAGVWTDWKRIVTIAGSATAAPTTGTYAVGDKVENSVPAAGGYIGWVCVTAGTPGTWKGYGLISS